MDYQSCIHVTRYCMQVRLAIMNRAINALHLPSYIITCIHHSPAQSAHKDLPIDPANQDPAWILHIRILDPTHQESLILQIRILHIRILGPPH